MWIRAEIRFRAKTIVTSLSRVISCLGIRGSKMEGVPTKVLGRATLPGVAFSYYTLTNNISAVSQEQSKILHNRLSALLHT